MSSASAPAAAAPPLISLRNVHFQYVARDVEQRGVTFVPGEDHGFQVNDVSLQVHAGERILLLGTNGSGKSTLLSLIGGKRMPRGGEALVLGRSAFDDTSLQRDVVLVGEPWPAEALFSCKVAAVVTPATEPERRDALARALHLPMQASLNKMSSGQKRRVQILHGLMGTKKVILLDESSTDIDVAERVTLMNFVAAECERIGACCVYATHILDGVEGWASRAIVMSRGRIVHDEPLAAGAAAAGSLSLEDRVSAWLTALSPDSAAAKNARVFQLPADHAASTSQNQQLASQPGEGLAARGVITMNNFTFRDLYENATGAVSRGRRILFCGCNGSGKTTLLELLAGRTFFANANDQLQIADRTCFQDTKLHELVTFCGKWWDRVPDGEMHVRELVPLPLNARAETLRALLCVNLDWDCRKTSTGELKRIQLLMKLCEFRPVILLDEPCADLDFHMRSNLLRFLYEESELRGVTIVYSTHIFEGLGEWPTDVMLTDRSQRKWLTHRCERGNVRVAPTVADGAEATEAKATEPLRVFLVRRLIELKNLEQWEKWYE